MHLRDVQESSVTSDQVYGAIGLTVIALAFVAVVFAVIADARAEKAFHESQTRFLEWLDGGMKGPKP